VLHTEKSDDGTFSAQKKEKKRQRKEFALYIDEGGQRSPFSELSGEERGTMFRGGERRGKLTAYSSRGG